MRSLAYYYLWQDMHASCQRKPLEPLAFKDEGADTDDIGALR